MDGFYHITMATNLRTKHATVYVYSVFLRPQVNLISLNANISPKELKKVVKHVPLLKSLRLDDLLSLTVSNYAPI